MKKLIVSLVVLALAGSASAELINYGGFETDESGGSYMYYDVGSNIPVGDSTGWLVGGPDNTSVVILADGWAGMNFVGSEFMHIGNSAKAGSVSQSFATDIGQAYDLSLLACAWSTMGDGYIDISVGDLVLDDLTVLDYATGGATLLEYTFTATAATSTLTLTNAGAAGMSIDEVSVVPVPEPATMCLLGLGGLLIRRKR